MKQEIGNKSGQPSALSGIKTESTQFSLDTVSFSLTTGPFVQWYPPHLIFRPRTSVPVVPPDDPSVDLISDVGSGMEPDQGVAQPRGDPWRRGGSHLTASELLVFKCFNQFLLRHLKGLAQTFLAFNIPKWAKQWL